jgi:hypothetical protein
LPGRNDKGFDLVLLVDFIIAQLLLVYYIITIVVFLLEGIIDGGGLFKLELALLLARDFLVHQGVVVSLCNYVVVGGFVRVFYVTSEFRLGELGSAFALFEIF